MSDKNFKRCQRTYDNLSPEDVEPPDQDECEHEWKYVTSNDDVTLYKCKRCGKEDLV
jgi:hypothetical protein